ncbi:J domain-containing protein [Bradyrhizobium sp.]|uniref:J domain-containing protein n=1 Tax=Bradyrhizobium sp. TaxID=376 RepID=UPI003BB01BE2
MYTLYDLLDARPQGDAKTLKKAFRKAGKATHPDVNYRGDPDAQLRFSQVVRAHDILSDAEKRAAYGRLLDFDLRQPRFKPNRSILSNTVNKLVSDVIAIGVLAVA